MVLIHVQPNKFNLFTSCIFRSCFLKVFNISVCLSISLVLFSALMFDSYILFCSSGRTLNKFARDLGLIDSVIPELTNRVLEVY